MRRCDAPTSTPGLAGAIMALLAVAATAAAVPAPMLTGGECRVAVRESQPMRAVAAVVAAACDLLGIERSNDAVPSALPSDELVQWSPRPPVVAPLRNVHSPHPAGGLQESLLNLPPPIC